MKSKLQNLALRGGWLAGLALALAGACAGPDVGSGDDVEATAEALCLAPELLANNEFSTVDASSEADMPTLSACIRSSERNVEDLPFPLALLARRRQEKQITDDNVH